MSLSEQEKVDGRKHLGYGGVQQASTFVLGVPAGVQTAFVIEGAFQRLIPASEPEYRRLIAALNQIEQQILDNTENVEVEVIGEITLRENAFQLALMRYKHFQGQLANLLQVTVNPFDMRPFFGSGGSGVNVPVVNC